MTDTATALLTPAMCELAELQYGMITKDQAAAAGEAGLPAALIAAGLAEPVTNAVIRLRAGARHPYPHIYAAWLEIAPRDRNRDADLEITGIASRSTALMLSGLIPQYSPVHEFTVHDYDWDQKASDLPDEENEAAEADAEPALWFHRTPRVPEWTVADGIPVTMPAQTLFDLAPRLDTTQLNQLALGFVEKIGLDLVQLRKDLENLCAQNDRANAAAEAELEERRFSGEKNPRPWIVPPRTTDWAWSVARDPESPF